MSNRIDLTQFESKHGTELYQKIQDYVRGNDYPDEIPLRIMGLYSDLIAELKRCYEEVDEKQRLLELHQDFVGSLRPYIGGHAIDEVKYAYEEALVNAGFLWKCPDCGATYEDEQTCEFGCNASE